MCRKWNISYSALVIISCSYFIIASETTSISTFDKPNCEEKLIVDCDSGGDDAIAILLLLEAQKRMKQCSYEIVAITCSYGNTNEKQVEINVGKILTIANRPDIPIYAGAIKPLVWTHADTSSHVFGKDGFGEFAFDGEIVGKVDYSKPASVAMIELSKTYPTNLNILVLGPTTNVALAGALDREFFNRVKHIFVMGSSVAGVGNVRPGVEFNFAADPEANYILLNSTISSKLTLFPWETAVDSGYTNEWRINALKGQDSKIVQFLNKLENLALKFPTYQPVDVFTAAVMLLGDKYVKKSLECNVEAVVDGVARGAVLVDYKSRIEPRNVRIIQSVDIEMYKNLFLCIFVGQNCAHCE